MKIQIRQRGLSLTRARRNEGERRLGLALGRFADLIERVSVRITRAAVAPKNGDALCEIEVRLRPRSLRAADADADPITALDGAGRRLSRSLAHALEREQAWDEPRTPAPTKP